MYLSFMQNDLVLALCWTLIHSLWQGLLLAIVTGIVMIATRKSNAQKRYRLLTFLFFLFIGVTVITFVKELGKAQMTQLSDSPVHSIAEQLSTSNTVVTDAPSPVASDRFIDRFKEYFNTHASLVVTIWFIIFIAKFLKLGANLIYVQRLKNYRTADVTGEWKEKLLKLIARLGMHKKVRLLESGIVQVPLVMGILKPVILLPAGLLSHLPADEIEAILLHELAHIQRRDYFVNLVQSFAETMFFFNPALMWLSSMIREERENCCDDMAISVTNSKTKFINALIAFQEYNFSSRSYHVGFPGKKNQLLNRVKRIVNERNKTLNATEKSILSFGMAILIMFSFAAAKKLPEPEMRSAIISSSNNKLIAADGVTKNPASNNFYQLKHKPEETVSTMPVSTYSSVLQVPDTLPKKMLADHYSGKTVYGESDSLFTHMSINSNEDEHGRVVAIKATRKDGREYRLMKVNDVITEFSINNEEIAQSNFKEHAEEIDAIEAAYRYRRARMATQRFAMDSARRMNMFNKQRAMENRRLEDLKRQTTEMERDRKLFDVKRQRMENDQQEMLKRQLLRIDTARTMSERKRVVMDERRRKNDSVRVMNQLRMIGESKLGKLSDSLYRMNKLQRFADSDARKKDWALQRRIEDDAILRSSAEQIKNIMNDLEKENIKVDMKTGWFGLDNNQFVVDGKPMSKELHDKFKARYIGSNGMGYYYGPVQLTGRGVFLDYSSISR